MSVIANTFGGGVIWSSVSQFEVEEGLLVVAMLLFAALLASRRFRSIFGHRFLSRHLDARSPLWHLSTFLAAGGALSFTLLVLCNLKRLNDIIDIDGLDLVQYPLHIFGLIGGSALGEYGTLGYGALALLVWGLTVVFLSLARGFSSAAKRFALPSILFLTVVVLLFDPGEMDSQAVNLLSGFTFNGVSLVSNWFLLTVSLSLTISDLLYEGLRGKKLMRVRNARAAPSSVHASRVRGLRPASRPAFLSHSREIESELD